MRMNESAADMSWVEVDKLLRDLGAEEQLASRIEAERRERSWSQERLARELGKVGMPMPQSAISKIENPKKGDGGRRAISVDEALAFARAFEMPLLELLLPEGTLSDTRLAAEARQALSTGASMHVLREQAEAGYRQALYVVTLRGHEEPAFLQLVKDRLAAAKEELAQPREREDRYSVEARGLVAFLEDALANVGSLKRAPQSKGRKKP